jgi:ABC-2 type transport system permease protein
VKQTWRIARREFRSYFDHPTAYILLVAFLGLGLFLYFQSVYSDGLATLRPFFDLLPWLFLVFVPAITMRTLAEERRTGTLDWLLAQPVNEVQVVAGKFLGDWLFALVALAGTLPTAAGLLMVADPDPGVMVAQYVGGALLAATMVGVGLFASSTTKNQITAFILSVAVGFVLVLAGMGVVGQTLPTALAAPVGRLSVLTHFDAVARGVIDLRDVLYFLSVTFVFCSLAYFNVTRRRLSDRRGGYRRLQVGVGALVLGTLIFNLLGDRIHGRLDLTRNDLYTLSPGTHQVLAELDDLVTVTFYVSDELPTEVTTTRRDIRDVLEDYRRYSEGMLQIEEVHPEGEGETAEQARSLGVREIRFSVLRGDELQVKNGWLGLVVRYAGDTRVLPVVRQTDDLEYRLTSKIVSLLQEDPPVIAFLQGFGARGAGSFPELTSVLQERYEVRSMDFSGPEVPGLSPDSVRVAVLAAPTEEPSPSAVEALLAYVDEGGSALVLSEGVRVDPRARLPTAVPVGAQLDGLLRPWGVAVRPGVVYDLQSAQRIQLAGEESFDAVQDFPLWPLAIPERDHPAFRIGTRVGLAWPRPLAIVDTSRARPLLQTTEQGGVRAPGTVVTPYVDLASSPDSLGKRVLATVSRVSAARVAVVGDVTFLDPMIVRNNPQNITFASSLVDWLAGEERLIDIRSKDRSPSRLTLESSLQRALLKWLNLAGVPLLLVAVGAIRIVRRRRLAGRGWDPEEAGT